MCLFLFWRLPDLCRIHMRNRGRSCLWECCSSVEGLHLSMLLAGCPTAALSASPSGQSTSSPSSTLESCTEDGNELGCPLGDVPGGGVLVPVFDVFHLCVKSTCGTEDTACGNAAVLLRVSINAGCPTPAPNAFRVVSPPRARLSHSKLVRKAGSSWAVHSEMCLEV
jgi:hypothetical protein